MPILALAATALATTVGWQSVGDRGGVAVWKREVPGKPFIAFKARTVVPANIAKVAQVLADVERKKEWMPRLRKAELISQTSPTERVEYNHTEAPWPASDRDFVFKALVTGDPAAGILIIDLKSISDPAKPPLKGIVRGHMYSKLTLAAKGAATEVTLEVEADPKGLIPAWIVNTFQRHWPRAMLNGLRRQATHPAAPEHPEVKKAFGL